MLKELIKTALWVVAFVFLTLMVSCYAYLITIEGSRLPWTFYAHAAFALAALCACVPITARHMWELFSLGLMHIRQKRITGDRRPRSQRDN